MRGPNCSEEVKMKKTFSLLYFTVLMLALITLMTSCALYEKFADKTECTHRDKNDDLICDRCGESYDDGEEPKNRTVTDTYGFIFLIPADNQANAYLTGYKGNELNVVIPSTCEGLPVSNISADAFANKSIRSVHIPASVKFVADSAFSGCYNLKSITVAQTSKSFVSINGNLYSKDGKRLITYALGKEDTVFNIPEGVTSVGYSTFEGVRNLKEISFPYGVDIIHPKMFKGSSIESVSIPGSVTEIGESAFEDCVNLVSVTIGNGVSIIDYHAFKNCSSLESIVIPNSVMTFGEMVFEGCTSLKSAVIGSGISNEPYGMFEHCTALESVIINEGAYAIFPFAFRGCSSLKSVTIPETVKTIYSYAFQGCTSLAEIIIPDRVNIIQRYTFSGCTSLISIRIPKNVTEIEVETFSGCTSLVSIEISNNLTTIRNKAFYGCRSLVDINIPNTVTDISVSAFEGCTSLTQITLPDGLSIIQSRLFYGCSSLVSINIPKNVTCIQSYAFAGCDNLNEVVFDNPDSWSITNAPLIFNERIKNPQAAAKYLRDDYSAQSWHRR